MFQILDSIFKLILDTFYDAKPKMFRKNIMKKSLEPKFHDFHLSSLGPHTIHISYQCLLIL